MSLLLFCGLSSLVGLVLLILWNTIPTFKDKDIIDSEGEHSKGAEVSLLIPFVNLLTCVLVVGEMVRHLCIKYNSTFDQDEDILRLNKEIEEAKDRLKVLKEKRSHRKDIVRKWGKVGVSGKKLDKLLKLLEDDNEEGVL